MFSLKEGDSGNNLQPKDAFPQTFKTKLVSQYEDIQHVEIFKLHVSANFNDINVAMLPVSIDKLRSSLQLQLQCKRKC